MGDNLEIQQLLVSLLFDLKSRLAKSMKGNRFNLAPMHQKALAYFSHFPHSTQQELADRIGRNKAQITRLLKELEFRGLIQRQREKTDKRSFRILVTEQGKEAFLELKKQEVADTQKLLTGFSRRELEQLKASLKKMHSNFSIVG